MKNQQFNRKCQPATKMVHKIHVDNNLVQTTTGTLPKTFLDTQQHNNKQQQSRTTKAR